MNSIGTRKRLTKKRKRRVKKEDKYRRFEGGGKKTEFLTREITATTRGRIVETRGKIDMHSKREETRYLSRHEEPGQEKEQR